MRPRELRIPSINISLPHFTSCWYSFFLFFFRNKIILSFEARLEIFQFGSFGVLEKRNCTDEEKRAKNERNWSILNVAFVFTFSVWKSPKMNRRFYQRSLDVVENTKFSRVGKIMSLGRFVIEVYKWGYVYWPFEFRRNSPK